MGWLIPSNAVPQDSGVPSEAHGSESASVIHKPCGPVRLCVRMCRWILLKHRFWSSRFGVGTLDSFLIGSRGGWCCWCRVHTGRTGVWMTLTLAVGQPSHYGHQYVWGLGPKNQHVLGAIHSGLTWCLVIRDCQWWVIPDLLKALSYQSQRAKARGRHISS